MTLRVGHMVFPQLYRGNDHNTGVAIAIATALTGSTSSDLSLLDLNRAFVHSEDGLVIYVAEALQGDPNEEYEPRGYGLHFSSGTCGPTDDAFDTARILELFGFGSLDEIAPLFDDGRPNHEQQDTPTFHSFEK